jgi:hypothetical protein
VPHPTLSSTQLTIFNSNYCNMNSHVQIVVNGRNKDLFAPTHATERSVHSNIFGIFKRSIARKKQFKNPEI